MMLAHAVLAVGLLLPPPAIPSAAGQEAGAACKPPIDTEDIRAALATLELHVSDDAARLIVALQRELAATCDRLDAAYAGQRSLDLRIDGLKEQVTGLQEVAEARRVMSETYKLEWLDALEAKKSPWWKMLGWSIGACISVPMIGDANDTATIGPGACWGARP